MASVRPPAVAGLFYPSLAAVLSRDVDDMLFRTQECVVSGELIGLIAPHAGYIYSGLTAATGYKLLKNKKFDSIIIVGPSHREYFDGISIFPGDAYRTPLGDARVDEAIRTELIKECSAIELSHAGHRSEHAIEVQLPFLQKLFGTVTFVPIVMGDQRREYCVMLAEAIAKVATQKRILLIASSDLSHYHPYDSAVVLDRKVIREVEDFAADNLMQKLETQEVEACGGGPMVSVMHAARLLGAKQSHVLYYCNSGDVTGEKDAVVGYLSAALTRVN